MKQEYTIENTSYVYLVTTLDSGSICKQFYDMLNHTELTADKTTIQANETSNITIKIIDYQGNLQDVTQMLKVKINDMEVEVNITNGTGTYQFTPTQAGTYNIQTVLDMARNSDITITVQ